MDTMQKIALMVHTLIALSIIGLVLLQRGKGADAGAAFGAGASGTVFGARGSASFFSRATAVLATAFFVSSLTLAYLSSQRTSGPTSLLEDAPVVEAPMDAGETPALDTALPDSDMSSLEPADDSLDLPAFEDESPATDDSP